MKPKFAHITTIDMGFNKPDKFRVCGSINHRFVGSPEDGFCWLTKDGWVEPRRENVKRYSTFSNKSRAVNAAKKFGIVEIID